MRFRKFRLILTLLLLGVGGWTSLRGDDDSERTEEQQIMDHKLSHSQDILASLAKEDFASMAASAEELMDLTEEQWVVNETPEFRAHLKNFWVVLEGLKTSAESEDLDEATVAYMQMTLSCVKCHKYLRRKID